MKIESLLPAVCALAVFLFSGCAAMFDGTKGEVHFTSEPSGATVIAGDQTGTTPVSLKLPKSTKLVKFVPPKGVVTAAAPGAEAAPAPNPERELALDRQFGGGWFLMDLLFTPGFGLSGMLIDGTTSAWYKLPGFVHCDFTKPPGPAVTAEAKGVKGPVPSLHTDG